MSAVPLLLRRRVQTGTGKTFTELVMEKKELSHSD